MLGHSFSQRRKSSKRPRDLHIRKVSFSGCSLSSGCSFSSSSSTSTFTPRAHMPDRVDSAVGIDGLHSQAAHHAPPRLNERPLIKTGPRYQEPPATFYDDDEESEEENERYYEEDGVEFEMMHPDAHNDQPRSMDLPPCSSPMDHTSHDREEPQDYFLLQLAKRPQLNRSHWSESTIQTLDIGLSTPGSGVATPSEAATTPSEDPVTALCPMPPPVNFSHKRLTSAPAQVETTPKRPPFKPVDSVENFVKRGGWKRRGIVFNGEEVSGSEDDEE